MKGHEALIAMRRAGWKPAMVTLDLWPCPQEFWRDWSTQSPPFAHILIEPTDSIERLDLRFVVGLMVTVQGDDERRVGLVAKAAVAADARHVIAGCGHHEGYEYVPDRFAFTNEECLAWPT